MRPGPYDEVCAEAQEATDASAIVLLVLGGKRGSAFSFDAVDPLIARRLPGLLRFVASEIEREIAACPGC